MADLVRDAAGLTPANESNPPPGSPPLGGGVPRTAGPLSMADVRRLSADRSAEARIETMVKVVAEMETGRLEGTAARLARDVLERFARDAEAAVREAVAWQVSNSPLLSEDMGRRLAADIAAVAFPILRHSTRVTDELLLDVLAEGNPEKQVAIAGRPTVSPVVSDAIVESANLKAIDVLLRNDGAAIADPTLEKVADRYGEVPFVAEPLAARPELPLSVVEKIIHRVSEEARSVLVERYDLPPAVVTELVRKGREAVTMLMLRPLARRHADMDLLARHLYMNARLTPSLLFRALCSGDVALFIAGMAVRAEISAENAQILLMDDGPLALRAVLEKARIPTVLLPAFRSALKVLKEQHYAGGEEGRHAYQVGVLARVYAECGHIEEPAMDDLLLQLFDQKSDDMIEQAMDLAGMPFHPLRSRAAG